MNKVKKIIIILLGVIIFLIILNHYMSYSMKIANSNFYLVETMATSKEGKPLLGLYYKDKYGGYKGVDMSGFPKIILWNDKYLITKNYDGNDSSITSYVIINLDSVSASNGIISEPLILKTTTEYNDYMQQNRLSELKMKQIDNCILWWELLLKEKFGKPGSE